MNYKLSYQDSHRIDINGWFEDCYEYYYIIKGIEYHISDDILDDVYKSIKNGRFNSSREFYRFSINEEFIMTSEFYTFYMNKKFNLTSNKSEEYLKYFNNDYFKIDNWCIGFKNKDDGERFIEWLESLEIMEKLTR